MAKRKKPPKPGYAPQGSRAQQNNLVAQGVTDSLPAGTAYVMGSDNLGYGVAVAYDSTGNALGFVRANLAGGARVDYNPSGQAVNIASAGSGPPTPAASPPTTPPPPKFAFNNQDEQYVNDMAARERAFKTMLANTTAGEDTLGSGYGFGFRRYEADQFNPQGVLVARAGDVDQTSLSTPTQFNQEGLDPSNPFSRASLLNQSYVRAGRVGEGSYANRGLLTSGAYARSLSRGAENRAKSFDSLQKDFAARLNDYRNQRESGYSQYNTDRTNIFRDAFARQRDTFLANNPS